jgi:hypothetical protein
MIKNLGCFTPECGELAENFFLLHIKDGIRAGEHALTAVCKECARRLRFEETCSIMDIEDIGAKGFIVAEIIGDYDMIAFHNYPPTIEFEFHDHDS